MLRIILIIIAIAVAIPIISALAAFALYIGGALLVIGLVVAIWKVAGVAGILGLFGVIVAFVGIAYIIHSVQEHDEEKKKLLEKQILEQRRRDADSNEANLITELNENYKKMGYMPIEEWRKKLPNFVSKDYNSSFDSIVVDFTKQIQEQKITKNKDWLEPFVTYILSHEQGTTVNKLLAEVNSDDLAYTHFTDDRELLDAKLREGTVSTSKDVPALFEVVSTAAGDLYKPTKYLKKIYGVDEVSNNKSSMTEEISFDDL